MDNLTPTLNNDQIKQNIDALQSQGVTNDKIQAYVNNYSKDPTSGNYVLKGNSLGITPSSTIDSTTPQTTTTNTLDDASNALQTVFSNKNIGKVLGTPLGALETAVSDPQDLKNYDWNPHVTAGGVAGDVAGDAINLISLGLSPETGGGSLLARSGINAAIGGGLSLANSASNGQDIFGKNSLENAGGSALLSSILPVLAKMPEGFVNATKGAAGINAQIENELSKATPEELKNYVQTTLAHNADLNTPTATGAVAAKLDEAADQITQKLKVAGQGVGDALAKNSSTVIGTNSQTGNAFTDDALSNFNKKVEDTFGHEITNTSPAENKLIIGDQTVSDAEPIEPALKPLEGRSRTIVPADKNRILQIHSQITDLANNPTIAKASDVIHNLDDLIDYSKVDQVGINHDPLQGIIRSTRGEINAAIRASSPEVAAANDTFSHLKDIENEIGEKAGNDLQRSALVMRRVFSGDQSGKSMELLNNIKNETGIDLVKHAALAKFATDSFGNEASKSLLQQELNTGGSIVTGAKRSIISPIKAGIAKLVIPDTENYAMRIAKAGQGDTGIISNAIRNKAPGFISELLNSTSKNPEVYGNTLDELFNSVRGRGLLRTYFNNLSAAHPGIGKTIAQGSRNLLKNTTGI